jgi:hypothetical protein
VFLLSFGFTLILFRKDTSGNCDNEKILSHSIGDEGYTLTVRLIMLQEAYLFRLDKLCFF